MYHGQVMVDQDRIPQLLQTAQLLEVRGLSEISEGEESPTSNTASAAAEATTSKGSQSFLAGLLNSSSTTKRPMSVVSDSCSNSSPTPPPAAKRPKGSASSAARPVPMLQSILSQQLAVPNTPTFDLAMGSSTRALTALANKVQAKSMPTSLESLLSTNISANNLSAVLAKQISTNNGDNHSTTSSSSTEDAKDRMLTESATFTDVLDRTNSSHGRGKL